MKFVIDERVKHRLTGLMVIISIAVIFLPAMLKKSNKRFEENVSVTLRLPSKPAVPKVAVPNQQAMFQSVKVAQVEIPSLVKEQRISKITKAESLAKKAEPAAQPVAMAKEEVVEENIPSSVQAIVMPAPTPVVAPKEIAKMIAKPTPVVAQQTKKAHYAVQIASFVQKSNAESLVARLRKQGYVASYNKFVGKQGEYYQVLVGQVAQRNEAIVLQKKLTSNLQLNGLIVKAG